MRIEGIAVLWLAASAFGAPAASTVVLQSSGSPSFLSTAITLTAVVTPAGATGGVTFFDGVVPIGSGALAAGKATLSTPFLATGNHSLTAFYRGDPLNQSSTSAAVSQTVLPLGQNGFQPQTTYSGVVNPREAVAGDFNGDGKMDLVVANFGGNGISVMLGKGDGTFLAPVNYQSDPAQFTGSNGLVVADFNGDNRLDVAMVNGSTLIDTMAVFLGNGDGTFRTALSYPVLGNPHSIAVADFNGDGIPDLATDNFLFSSINIFIGKGDGTFQPAVTLTTPPSPIQIVAGDFNGDGRTDIALLDLGPTNQSQLSIMLGKGNGAFAEPVNYPLSKTAGKIVAADVNGDGRADLVITSISDSNVSVMLGKGDGTFQPGRTYAAGTGTTSVLVRDFNADGVPDIATTNSSAASVSVLLGNGDGTFQTAVNYPVGSDPLAFVAADFNADGRTDLAVGNYLDGNIGVLLGVPVSEPIISLVQNGASFLPGFAANAWMTIKGANLSSVTDTWDKFIVNGQLPTKIDSVSVTVGGQPAYVYFVSAGQINVVAPNIAPGKVNVVVSNSQGVSLPFTANTQTDSPAFFLWNNTYPVATRQDFTYAVKNGTFAGLNTVAAKPGDVIILWGSGFGPTNPAAPIGSQVPASAFPTATAVTVNVGNVPATVYGAALAPGYAGLFQVAIQIPPSLADGDYPVIATVNGVSSPANAVITVQH